ncbi:MAG: aldo/keto reductase [Ruminococcaceae bacterium]|nr:aldo/keto reductase [Oscillospiraceae bacterium]
MKTVTLGSTNITTPQNAFGALPLQRDTIERSVAILQRAYEGGFTFFDTARAYSDSEEKIGLALSDVRKNIFIATKTMAQNTEDMKVQLETSLKTLKTDYIDIYQFHCAGKCFKPGDGTGMYELMEDFKRQGLIRHIGLTAHKIGVAEECIESGLYETLQFPFSYLSSERELALADKCKKHNMGFIAMKALGGGMITDSRAAFAFIAQYDNVLPIWGIQRESELEEWISYMKDAPKMTREIRNIINADKEQLGGDFCRGCGYCMPCPAGIQINNCARMSLMLRRAPSDAWLSETWQKNMKQIEGCLNCGQCRTKCPYELDTPRLLRENYEDYKKVLAGEVDVRH